DIVPLYIDDAWKEEIRAEIPELPDSRMNRYIKEMDLSDYDAGVITSTKEMADFFENTVNLGADAKQAANWLMGDLSAHLNKQGLELHDLAITPEALAKMIHLVKDGTISSKIAKKVFAELLENGGDPEKIVKEKGLVQMSEIGRAHV